MEVRVKLFATLRDRVGAKEVALELPEGATVATLREQIAVAYPALVPSLDNTIVAVNRQFASPDTLLHAEDEVALFPPVSGGASNTQYPIPTLCHITTDQLDLNDIVRRLTLPTSGAVVIFTGAVRATEKVAGGKWKADRQVAQLYYEAYIPMAEAKLQQVAAEMRERFPHIEGIALIQRVGLLDAGEPTIVVAVSAPHRGDGCFEAARYGIDRIKEIVPVWKKEIGPNGEAWIEGHYRPEAGE